MHSGRPLHRQVAQALQSALAQIGVTAEIRLVEGGTHWSTTKAGDYEMAVSYASSDTIDPDQMAGFLIVNPERANAYHTEWKNERVNELYEKERATNSSGTTMIKGSIGSPSQPTKPKPQMAATILTASGVTTPGILRI